MIGVPSLEKREQVFVSSTYIDLTDEREKVIQGLLEADCFPAGMEMFPASDDEKWDLIKGVIDDSDYYLLIIGGRYGAEDSDAELSYTEMEYDYAIKQKKPIMAFVHADPGKIVSDKTDQDDTKRAKLDAFRVKVQGRMVKMWTSGDQLPGFVAQALMKLRKTHPATGWVRGDLAMTPAVELEISELNREIEQLRGQIAATTERRASLPDLADGADPVGLMLHVIYVIKSDTEGNKRVADWETVRTTWDHIFQYVGPTLMQEAEEGEIATRLEAALLSDFYRGMRDANIVVDVQETMIHADEIGIVLVQLRALNYMEHGRQKRSASDKGKYWVLTEEGEDRLMQLRAIRKTIEGVDNCDEVSAAIRDEDTAK